MKVVASVIALLALAALAAPLDAAAGGRHGHRTIVVVGGSAFVAHPFLVHRPVANRSIIVVRRPFVRSVFLPPRPVIVQRTIVLPGGTLFFFSSPTGFVVTP